MEEQVKALEFSKEFSFSERFRELRTSHGWSQSYIAARIDVGNTTISRWESGEALPAIRFWHPICELFDVDAEALGLLQKEEEEEQNIAIHGRRGLPNARLKRQRELLGWSQVQVADAIATYPVNISRWERGETRPDGNFQQKLCELFKKKAEELGFSPEEELIQEGK